MKNNGATTLRDTAGGVYLGHFVGVKRKGNNFKTQLFRILSFAKIFLQTLEIGMQVKKWHINTFYVFVEDASQLLLFIQQSNIFRCQMFQKNIFYIISFRISFCFSRTTRVAGQKRYIKMLR